MSAPVWSPMRYSDYRLFWICALVSTLGTWVQDVAASWVMTHLSTSPLVISLLSFSNSFPLMLLSIPSGLMADRGDRRKILLFAQSMMFFAALILGYKIMTEDISATLLLSLCFVMGVGSALNGPSFQTVLSDLVPAQEQQAAILFFYMGINATRVLGPALGGALLAYLGPSWAFWLNAVSFLGLILFFYLWPIKNKTNHTQVATASSLRKIERADWQVLFSQHNLKLWAEIFVVTFCAACLWALYPVKGRVELQLGSFQYGSLLGFLGLGACVSAVFSRKLMGGATAKALARAYLFYALGLLLLSVGKNYELMCAGMFLSGIGWIVLATLMNMSSRQATGNSPLKATMLGAFLCVFYLGMSSGSLFWGSLAHRASLEFAFALAAGLLALAGLYKSFAKAH